MLAEVSDSPPPPACTSNARTYTHSFLESKQQERQNQPHFFHLPGASVRLQRGEFLCPLCQSPCNTVLPLLMPLPPATPPSRPANDMSLAEWLKLMQMATDLAEGDHMDTGKCVCSLVITATAPFFCVCVCVHVHCIAYVE